MKNRSELFSIYQKFSAEILTQFGASIRILRSDNAKEYVSVDFSNFLAKQGTLHQTTCPHTPQQNGVAERKNRHLIETARTLLIHMHVPLHFWADAVLASSFLINRMPSSVLDNDIPYHLLHPDVPLYPLSPHIFGCTCFVHDLTPGKDKLTSKAFKCIFLGYSRLQKGYRCYSPDLKRYLVSADVTFLDQQPFHSIPSQLSQVDHVLPVPFLDLSLPAAGPPIPDKQPPASIPADRPLLTYQRRRPPVPPVDSTPADSLPPAVDSSPPDPSPEALPIAQRKGTRTTRNPYPLYTFLSYDRLSSPHFTFVSSLSSISIPKTTGEALSHPGWRQAMLDEMTALHSNGTWDLVSAPPEKSTVGTSKGNNLGQRTG